MVLLQGEDVGGGHAGISSVAGRGVDADEEHGEHVSRRGSLLKV